MISAGIIKAGAIFAAVSTMSVAAWTAADYTDTRPILKREFRLAMQQLEQTSQSVLLIQFQLLMQKKEMGGGLTIEEQQQLCQIVAALNWGGQELKNQTGC